MSIEDNLSMTLNLDRQIITLTNRLEDYDIKFMDEQDRYEALQGKLEDLQHEHDEHCHKHDELKDHLHNTQCESNEH